MLFLDAEGRVLETAPRVSLLDHGFLFGDSIYEVARAYSRRLFGWPEHRERLLKSAERMGISLESILPQLEPRMSKLLGALNADHAAIRIIITRGEGRLHIDYRSCSAPQVFMVAWKLNEKEMPSAVRLMIPKIHRNSKEALDPAIKSGNYLNSVLAFREAVDLGFDDALMLNVHGEVTELTTSNIGWFRAGQIETPDADVGILHGVTRRILSESMKVAFVRVQEGYLKQIEDPFVLSTLKEMLPVSELRLSSGEILKFSPSSRFQEARQAFRQLIEKRLECEKVFY